MSGRVAEDGSVGEPPTPFPPRRSCPTGYIYPEPLRSLALSADYAGRGSGRTGPAAEVELLVFATFYVSPRTSSAVEARWGDSRATEPSLRATGRSEERKGPPWTCLELEKTPSLRGCGGGAAGVGQGPAGKRATELRRPVAEGEGGSVKPARLAARSGPTPATLRPRRGPRSRRPWTRRTPVPSPSTTDAPALLSSTTVPSAEGYLHTPPSSS